MGGAGINKGTPPPKKKKQELRGVEEGKEVRRRKIVRHTGRSSTLKGATPWHVDFWYWLQQQRKQKKLRLVFSIPCLNINTETRRVVTSPKGREREEGEEEERRRKSGGGRGGEEERRAAHTNRQNNTRWHKPRGASWLVCGRRGK